MSVYPSLMAGKNARVLYLDTGKASVGRGIEQKFKQYNVQLRNMPKNMFEVNRRAVAWLSRAAEKELRYRIRSTGREQSSNPSLVKLAGNYEANSSWGISKFRFFDPTRVAKSEAAPYYRAIELGSTYWSSGPGRGRRIPLVFLSGGQYHRPGEGRRKDYVTYRGAGGGDEGVRSYAVKITRPIRPYYYITTAVEKFKEEKIYTQIVLGMIRQRAPLLYRAAAGRDLAAIRTSTGSTGRP